MRCSQRSASSRCGGRSARRSSAKPITTSPKISSRLSRKPSPSRMAPWKSSPTRLTTATGLPLFRGHHLLGAPLAEQGPQRCRLDRFVEDRDLLLPGGSPHMRTAIRGDQDRRNAIAEPAANGPDRGDALAGIEVIGGQTTGDPPPRSPRRRWQAASGGPPP